MSNLTTHLQNISESLGFKPSSVVVENGIAKINFAQRDGSSGRLGVSLRKPLLEAGVTSDAITATADQVCVHFSQGANKANFVAGSPEWESYFDEDAPDILRDAELLKRKIKDKKADLTQTESNIEEGVALMKKSLANQNKAGYLRARQILANADRVRSSFSRTGAKAKFATDSDDGEIGHYEVTTANRVIKEFEDLYTRCSKKSSLITKQMSIIKDVITTYSRALRTKNYNLYRDAEYLSESVDRQLTASFSRTGAKAKFANRLIAQISDEKSPLVAKIYKDTEIGEYCVRFFLNGVLKPKADYCTEDLEDAKGTAKASVEHQRSQMSRVGAKANNARPSLQEVMKSIDDYRASGASEEAVKQYSETVLRAWQAESGR